MAKQATASGLNRLATKSVFLGGPLEWWEREQLTALAKAHGATFPNDIDASTDLVILRSINGAKAIQARVKRLNAKGASIQLMDIDTFARTYRPDDVEIMQLMRAVPPNAEQFISVAENFHGQFSPAPPRRTIRGEQFNNLDLTGFRWREIDFENCSFEGTTLNDCFFSSVTNCDFSGATGENANFTTIAASRFNGAKLARCTIHGSFEGLDLSNSQFPDLTLLAGIHARVACQGKSANISTANASPPPSIKPSNFSNAILSGAMLSNANLRGADFRGATLADVDLDGADLTGAHFDGADLTRCNLRNAKLDGVDMPKAKNYTPPTAAVGAIGPSLRELDNVAASARQIQIQFHVRRPGGTGDGEVIALDTADLRHGFVRAHLFKFRFHGYPISKKLCSEALMEIAANLSHWKVRYETLEVSSTKSSLTGKALRDLVTKSLAEAFAQPVPPNKELAAATRAYREKIKENTAADRQQREKAKQEAEKQKEKAKKQIAKKIEKQVGKVTDTATFLKALELRIEPEKIKKATKMLKASRFQLYNDVTDTHTSGVVKSQTDADLVYACRINEDGSYSCCTQNLNVCGGLRGSICKHLLVLIIGLVNANQLDPVTIDQWVAKSQNAKPVLDKEKMGEIFIRYKGAEAGEVDWRPTETLPEDYYSL